MNELQAAYIPTNVPPQYDIVTDLKTGNVRQLTTHSRKLGRDIVEMDIRTMFSSNGSAHKILLESHLIRMRLIH